MKGFIKYLSSKTGNRAQVNKMQRWQRQQQDKKNIARKN